MINSKKKILSILAIFISALFVFIACGKNPYKDLRLSLSVYEETIVLTDDMEEGDYFFTVSSTVTGRPKNYAGEVTATLSTAGSRSVLEFVSQTEVEDGKTDFTYKIISVGRADIEFRTRQGNKRNIVSVNVVRNLESISFEENSNGFLPIPVNETTNLLNYIKLHPFNTSQKDVEFSVSLPQGATPQELEQLNSIVIANGNITIPENIQLSGMVLTATSIANPEISATVNVAIIKQINANEIDMFWNAEQSENNISLKQQDGSYFIELAKNEPNLALKRIYFTFENSNIEDYEISVAKKYQTSSQSQLSTNLVTVNKISGNLQNGVFDISSITEGDYTVEFKILPKEYKSFEQMARVVKLNVKVVSYPEEIQLLDPSSNNSVNSVVLFDVYSNNKGTPLKINVLDETGFMQNQLVSFNLSDPNSNRILLHDEFGREIPKNRFSIKSGDIVYITHNLEQAEATPQNLSIVFTSQSYGEVKSELLLNFERGIIDLRTTNNELRLNITQQHEELGFYGYAEVELQGLPVDFDYNNLNVVVANSNIAKVYITDEVIAFYGNGIVGKTTATITAANGSSISVDITAFEALNSESTEIRVANQTFLPIDQNATLNEVIASGRVLTFKNNLQAIDVNFIVNGIMQQGLPTGLLTSIVARDIINGEVQQNSMSVVNVRANTNQLRTLNQNGSSLVTVAITGYNEEGERNQNLFFKFVINVEVPVDYIQTNSVVSVYDRNLLSINESNLGVYNIILNTFPVNSNFSFENMQWALHYRNVISQPVITHTDLGVNYRFNLQGIASYVTLNTFYNDIKRATVEVRLGVNASNIENFTLTLSINRPVPDETGELPLNYVMPSTQIRFSAIKPQKIDNIVLDERDSVISFDSRKLEANNEGIFQASNRERVIGFTTLPANADNTELGVRYSSSAISVWVDNINKQIIINPISKTSSRILIEIYAKDSEFSQGDFGKKVELYVDILDGSKELPFRIENATDLESINQDLTAHYVLTNNINLSQLQGSWTPIGYRTNSNGTTSLSKFTGSLNGGYIFAGETYNYTISGLKYNNGSEQFNHNYIGLFGVIGTTGVVENITFTNISINVNENQNNQKDFAFVGVVAGLNEGEVSNIIVQDGNGITAIGSNEQMFDAISQINNPNNTTNLSSRIFGIRVSVTYNSATEKIVSVGGVVGVNTSKLTKNKSYVLINYSDRPNTPIYAGGITGVNIGENAVITNTVDGFYTPVSEVFDVVAFINIDTLSGELQTISANSATGGVVGFNAGVVENQIARAVILKANNYVGGLIGFSAGTQTQEAEGHFAKVYNNLSVPTISGQEYVGGLIGFNENKTYILDYAEQEAGVNYLGIKQLSHIQSNSEVVFNKVEFLDLITHQTSAYNSGVIAKNFAGGLIGGAHETYTSDVDGNGSIFETAIHSNTVFTYHSNQKPIANYYSGNNLNNGSYFGDILLQNNHTETNSDNDNRNLAGGLVGESTYFGIYANNEIFANIQAQTAIVGGVVGGTYYGYDIYYSKHFLIANTNVGGRIVNRNLTPTATPVTAAFLGEAKNLFADYDYDTYAKNYLNGQPFVRDNGIHYSVNFSIAIITDESGESVGNVSNVFGIIEESSESIPQYNAETVFVKRSQESVEEFENRLNGITSALNQNFNIHSIAKDNDQNLNGILDSVDNLIKTEVDKLLQEMGANFFNVLGNTTEQIEQKKTDIIEKVKNAVSTANINTVWYRHNSINNNRPVLLSVNRYNVSFYVLNNTLNYTVSISLQTNWPPVDISITPLQNHKTVFNQTQNEPVSSVIFYHNIHQKHYIPNTPNKLLNFNNSNLSDREVEELSLQVHNQLKTKNTYQLSSLFNINTDGVLGMNSVMVKSSNPSILSVEVVGSNIVLVAKGTGRATIEIYSTYNKEVKETYNLDIVNAVLPVGNNLGVGLYKPDLNGLVSLNRTDQISVIKSSEGYTNTRVLRALQSNNINLNGYNFEMPTNQKGGIRYYILNKYTSGSETGYGVYFGSKTEFPIKINNNNFNEQYVQLGGQTKYAYYIDVPYGANSADASITSNELSNNQILAVPYVLDGNNNKIVLLNNHSLNKQNATFKDAYENGAYGIVSQLRENAVEILQDFAFANQIEINVLLGTRDLHANISAISIEPVGNANFTISIDTDNYNELLYLTYENQDNITQTVLVENRYLNINNNAYEIDFYNTNANNGSYYKGINQFTIEDIDVFVEYSFSNGVKTYNFNLSVSDNKRLHPETFKTITEEFLTTLNFFVASRVNEIEFSNNEQTPHKIEILEAEVFKSQKISLKLTPQKANNILLTHYPNGDLVQEGIQDGGEIIYSDEASFNNILPGKAGILKINVVPYFASFDYIELTVRATGGFDMSLEQLHAHYNITQNSFDPMYTSVHPFAEKIPNGIRLTKQSYKAFEEVSEGEETNRDYGENKINYDGMFYVRTLISHYTHDLSNFVLTVKGYVGDTVNRQEVFASSLELDVIIPPSINLSYKGQKEAPLAIGTTIEFDANLRGVSGLVVFDSPDFYSYILPVGAELGDMTNARYSESDFNIIKSATSSTGYKLTTAKLYSDDNPNGIKPGEKLVVNGVISQTINGETTEYRDTLIFTFVEFTINSISVVGVNNGLYDAVYGEINDLAISIDAHYDKDGPSATEIEQEINALERYWSSVTEGKVSANTVWYYTNNFDQKILISSAGYNSPRNTYTVHTGGLLTYPGVIGLRIQNTTLNANDVLGARVRFVYSETGEFGGVKPIVNIGDHENVIELTTEFSFRLYRASTEDHPEPIRTVDDLLSMQSGHDYILLNDLYLTNWTPLNTDIGSLDGNGYVLTVRSFNLPDRPASSNELTQTGNIGIFGEISENTIIKNLTIEIEPSSLVSLSGEVSSLSETSYVDLNINATAYQNINFGLLAGVNRGVATNIVITHNASELKLRRDVLMYEQRGHFENDPDINFEYINSDGTFNYNKFLKENFSKYFPRQRIINQNDSLWEDDEINYNNIAQSTRRDLSVVRVLTWVLPEGQGQTHNMATLVGVNHGYITNSAVNNISLSGTGYVAGFVARNLNQISSSYYSGGNIINRSLTITNSATAGFVVHNFGDINYSYVMGREGDGNNYQYGIKEIKEVEIGIGEEQDEDDGVLYNIAILTPSNNSDKTGLGKTRKDIFAGSEYNNYIKGLNHDKEKYNTDFKYGALRAMNSSISSGGSVAGFVYTNSGEVSNSYANILLDSSKSSAGFVYQNEGNGIISDVYTLSSVPVESRVDRPFTGVNESTYEVLNFGSISYSYYLQGDDILFGKNGQETIQTRVYENFASDSEVATMLNYSGFMDYNSFQGFAFNSDYSNNEDINRSVWFMPNGYEVSNNNNVLQSFKKNHYLQFRPELVAANLNTFSVRRLNYAMQNESEHLNNYRYISDYIGDSVLNPILILSSEDFNTHILNESNAKDDKSTNSIRFVKDIDFNMFETQAKTYAVGYYGDLDGNGMSINNLRLVSDNDFETENGAILENLGLFGAIKGEYTINSNDERVYTRRGIVRNLNINVGEVRGTKVTSVGVLAGTIENGIVSNIKISGAEVVQGKNTVGGLAGTVLGDSEVVNIVVNGIGANANYIYDQENPFTARNNNSAVARVGTFTMYNSQIIGDRISNINKVSYAGGAIGLLDVDEIEENKNSSLRSARVRKISVGGSVNLVAEIAGGIIGGVYENSVAIDLDFQVSANPRISASRVAGGIVGDLRGIINRASLRHSTTTQNSIDNNIAQQVNANNRVISSSGINYNNLFSARNPIYMGGIAGVNIGGEIRNSLNRVNVININSMFGGGVVGLNIGGALHNVYTTASVSAFRAVGGIIGLQVQNNFVTEIYTNVGENNGDYNQIIENEETSYVYVGSGKGNYTKDLTLNQENDTDYLENLLYIDIKNADLKNPNTKTSMSGVVGANIWRETDVRLNNIQNQYGGSPVLGAMVGRVLLGENPSSNKFLLGDAFVVDGALSTVNRQYNDVNYFNQIYINNSYNFTNLNDENLIREIGSLNKIANSESLASVVSLYKRTTDEENLLFIAEGSANAFGKSGFRENVIEDGRAFRYYYSRQQNLSSGRTMKEIVHRVYLNSEAERMNLTETIASGENIIVELPEIYNKWPVNYWKGVEINKLPTGGYERVDAEFVMPQLNPVADLSIVYVYSAKDLELTTLYKNATFVLMDDIDISSIPNWESSGDDNIVFGGRIVSYSDEARTISGLTINNVAYNNYLGLIGYAENALFNNFNLKVNSISIELSEVDDPLVYIGALFGSGTGNTIQNITISSNRPEIDGVQLPFILSSPGVGAIGGVAGISTDSYISNVTVENANIITKTLHHNPIENQNFVGGAFGFFGYSGEEMPEIENIIADNVAIYVGKDQERDYSTEHSENINERIALSIGGVFGEVSNRFLHPANGMSAYNAKLSNISFTNPRAFNVNITHDESLTDSNLVNTYIGGIAGKSVGAMYDNVVVGNAENQTDEDYHNIEITTNNHNRGMFVGGAFGEYDGSLPNNDLDVLYNISNLKINNLNINYKQGERLLEGEDLDNRNIILAGAIGRSNGASVLSAEVFASINIDELISNNKSINELYVGGFAGLSQLNHRAKDLLVSTDISINGSNYLTSNKMFVGGVFARLEGTVSDRGIENANLGFSEIGAEGSIEINEVVAELNVGGMFGLVNNTNINKVFSNTNISLTDVSGVSVYAVGGLVGKITNQSGAGNVRTTTISNSYATGDIYLENNTNNLSAGAVVGLITSTDETENSGVVLLENLYSVSNIFTKDFAIYQNTSNRVGGIGEVVFLDEQTNRTTTSKVKINNVFYNAELVPNPNDIATGVLVTENSKIKTTLNDSAVWANTGYYPVLKLSEFMSGAKFESMQASGTRQNPITITSNTTYNKDEDIANKSFVITGNGLLTLEEQNGDQPGIRNLTNTRIYSVGNNAVSISNSISTHIDSRSIIYSAKDVAGAFTISDNHGKILGGNTISLNDNYGLILQGVAGGSIDELYKNEGIIDKSNQVSIIENVGTISESVILDDDIDNMGNIINSYLYTSDDNILYNSIGSEINLELNNLGTLNINQYNTNIDFIKTFAIFPNSEIAELNSGLPTLRWTLKDHYLDNEIKDNYLWAYDNAYTFGEFNSQTETYTGLVSDYAGKTIIEIENAQDLAKIAFMASVGKQTKNIEFNTESEISNVTTYSYADSAGEGVIKEITTISFDYGVKTTTVKHVLDFAGKQISIKNQINLKDKLWIPIGFSTEKGAQRLEQSHPLANNVFAGTINGNGNIISNMSAFSEHSSGLFGSATITTLGTKQGGGFAYNLVMQGGYSFANENAGAVVGRLYNFAKDEKAINYIANAVGVQKVQVKSGNIASGVFGHVVSSDLLPDNKPAMFRTYANTNILAGNSAYGLAFTTSNNQENDSVLVDEVYFAGDLHALVAEEFSISNVAELIENGVAYSTKTRSDSITTEITTENLATTNFKGFNWLEDGEWLRHYNVNDGYPIFDVNSKYWYKNQETPTFVSGYYEITKPEHLSWVSNESQKSGGFNGNIRLMNDIDLKDRIWTPIAKFTGTFDGNDFAIKNLVTYGYYKDGSNAKPTRESGQNNIGLIGEMTGTIKDLTISADEGNISIISGGNNVGVVARANNLTIENVLLDKTNVYGVEYVGGIVGYANGTTITNAQVYHSIISGRSYVGAIAGSATQNSKISNQYNQNENGDIASTDIYGVSYVGGLVGDLSINSVIEGFNISSSVSVIENQTYSGGIPTQRVGGVVGRLAGNSANYPSSIYEIRAGASVIITSNNSNDIGGVVGLFNFNDNSSKIENILHSGLVAIEGQFSSNGHGVVIGRATGGGVIVSRRMFENIYTTSNNTDISLIGVASNLANMANQTVTVKRYNNVSLTTNISLLHDETVSVQDILESSSVWRLSTIQSGFIDISYFNNKNDNKQAPKISGLGYEIIDQTTLNFVHWVTHRRLEDYTYNDYYIGQVYSPVRKIGSVSHPFVGKFYGSLPELSEINVASNNSLFGYVGVKESLSSNPTIISSFNLKPTNNITVEKDQAGLLMDEGYRVDILNIDIFSSSNRSFNSNGGNYIGAVAGKLDNSTITRVTNSIEITGNDYVGGIVGQLSNSTLNEVENNAAISGNDYVGGIVGLSSDDSFEEVENKAEIVGASYVGGIAGSAEAAHYFEAENTGSISGVSNIGGVVGGITKSDNGATLINRSLNNATITGSSNVGGIVGFVSSANGFSIGISSPRLESNSQIVATSKVSLVSYEGNDKDFAWWGLSNDNVKFEVPPILPIRHSTYQEDVLPEEFSNKISNNKSFNVSSEFGINYTFGLVVGNNAGSATISAHQIHVNSKVNAANLKIRRISFEKIWPATVRNIVMHGDGIFPYQWDMNYTFTYLGADAYTNNREGGNSVTTLSAVYNITNSNNLQVLNSEDPRSAGRINGYGSNPLGLPWVKTAHEIYEAKSPDDPYIQLILNDVQVEFDLYKNETFNSDNLVVEYFAKGALAPTIVNATIDRSNYKDEVGTYEIIVKYNGLEASYYVEVIDTSPDAVIESRFPDDNPIVEVDPIAEDIWGNQEFFTRLNTLLELVYKYQNESESIDLTSPAMMNHILGQVDLSDAPNTYQVVVIYTPDGSTKEATYRFRLRLLSVLHG